MGGVLRYPTDSQYAESTTLGTYVSRKRPPRGIDDVPHEGDGDESGAESDSEDSDDDEADARVEYDSEMRGVEEHRKMCWCDTEKNENQSSASVSSIPP